MHPLPPKPDFPCPLPSQSPHKPSFRHGNAGQQSSHSPETKQTSSFHANHLPISPSKHSRVMTPVTRSSNKLPEGEPDRTEELPKKATSQCRILPGINMSDKSDTPITLLVSFGKGGTAQPYRVEGSKLGAMDHSWAQWLGQSIPHLVNINANIRILPGHAEDEDYPIAFTKLLRFYHNPETGMQDLTVHDIFVLVNMKRRIGVNAAVMGQLFAGMGRFVDSCKNNGMDVRAGLWEKALNICVFFKWLGHFSSLAARLTFLCRTVTDSAGTAKLIKPFGGELNKEICGDETIAIIGRARADGIQHVMKVAQDGINDWVHRLSMHGCNSCRAKRMDGLTFALRHVGISPPTASEEVSKSIQQICDELDEDEKMSPECKKYAGNCSDCNEKVHTSFLFPVNDVLTEIRWGLHSELRYLVQSHMPPLVSWTAEMLKSAEQAELAPGPQDMST